MLFLSWTWCRYFNSNKHKQKMPLITNPDKNNSPVGVTLVDARNGFNESKFLTMLWTICHWCSKGSHFSFNCYCYHLLLIVRKMGKLATTLHSKEGITEGDPLAMLLYETTLTPLVKLLWKGYPHVLQPWYADDAAFIGPAKRNAQFLHIITKYGSDFDYYS